MPKSWTAHNSRLLRFENNICPKRCQSVAGIDEAGRGPLAGPVVAAAAILKTKAFKVKIFDSKQLSAVARLRAFSEINRKAYLGVGIVDSEIIDRKNILQASILAMQKAIANLQLKPDYLLVDGKFKQSSFAYPCRFIVGGDSRCLSIACASIVAKVVRDNLLSFYSAIYPQYDFEHNRGYFTKKHIKAIRKWGPTPIHRRSFRPIRDICINKGLPILTTTHC